MPPTYVGVDIGWSVDPKPETTGLATIEGDDLIDFDHVTSDDEILEYARHHDADYVGVDAPLVVENPSSQRQVESELQRAGYPVFPANTTWFEKAFDGVRGEGLVDLFVDHGFELHTNTDAKPAVIEVYPNPTIKTLLGNDVPPYKNGRKAEILDGLRELWKETMDVAEFVTFDGKADIVPTAIDDTTVAELGRVADLIDAFYSAYVLKMDAEGIGQTRVFGNLETGAILTAVPDE